MWLRSYTADIFTDNDLHPWELQYGHQFETLDILSNCFMKEVCHGWCCRGFSSYFTKQIEQNVSLVIVKIVIYDRRLIFCQNVFRFG